MAAVFKDLGAFYEILFPDYLVREIRQVGSSGGFLWKDAGNEP